MFRGDQQEKQVVGRPSMDSKSTPCRLNPNPKTSFSRFFSLPCGMPMPPPIPVLPSVPVPSNAHHIAVIDAGVSGGGGHQFPQYTDFVLGFQINQDRFFVENIQYFHCCIIPVGHFPLF
jgi:hypothetical protein